LEFTDFATFAMKYVAGNHEPSRWEKVRQGALTTKTKDEDQLCGGLKQ